VEGLFQPMHLLVIFVIALFIFGPKRLPELGKGLGDGIRALKEGLREQPSSPGAAAADKDKSTTETKS
jgi:sec-independent protein translocase protein TatA